jgi:hypothetical protein
MLLGTVVDIPFTFFTDLVPLIITNYSRRAPYSFRHIALHFSQNRSYSWLTHLTQVLRRREVRRRDEHGGVSWKYSSFTVTHVIYRLYALRKTLNFRGDAIKLHKLLGQSRRKQLFIKMLTRKANSPSYYVQRGYAVSMGQTADATTDSKTRTRTSGGIRRDKFRFPEETQIL